MTNLLIVGAGGFGREVYQWAKDSLDINTYNFKGFLSNNPSDLDCYSLEGRIIDDPVNYRVENNDRFLIAIGDIDTRIRLIKSIKEKGGIFLTLLHKTAVVASSATIGEGVIACPFALISANVILDDFVLLNTYASCGHDSVIGKYSVLSPYATTNGFVSLADEVFMATHSTVTPKRIVGYRSKISANSVVMRDVPERSLVSGVPGKHVRCY